MKIIVFLLLMSLSAIYLAQDLKTFHDFVVKDIDGKEVPLSVYKGKKILVVNTASKCGLTPQYKVLQELYEKYSDKFVVIGFPSNNFLKQEPGSEKEIKEFCEKNYGVTFPVMEKVSVSNYIYLSYPPDTSKTEKTEKDEIYRWLTEKEFNGVMDTEIQWNFHKFLIDENGTLVGSVSPFVGYELQMIIDWLLN
ncbi:MAG: glutathione peroxidase [Bacteroidota bacterium]